MKRPVLAVMFFVCAVATAGAEGLDLGQMTEQQRMEELETMQWIAGPGSHSLPLSHSRIELRDGQELLLGTMAARYDYLTGGIETPETEAIVWNGADGSLTYFQFFDVGYVTEEDWDRVDPAEFMTQIKEAGVEANAERERVGIDPFYISDWRQQPTFDTATHTAYWATDVTDIQSRWVNAVAIRLSRTGYQQIIWAGAGENFAAAQSTLADLLDGLHHESGYRYEDYADGDAHSGMSIGELAAATMGVEFGGGALAAALAFLLAFGKKGGIVLGLVGAGAAALFARSRRRHKDAQTPATTQPPPPAIE